MNTQVLYSEISPGAGPKTVEKSRSTSEQTSVPPGDSFSWRRHAPSAISDGVTRARRVAAWSWDARDRMHRPMPG